MFKKLLITSFMLLPLASSASASVITDIEFMIDDSLNRSYSGIVNGKKITAHHLNNTSEEISNFYVTIKNGTCAEYIELKKATFAMSQISHTKPLDAQLSKALALVTKFSADKAIQTGTCKK